MSSSFDAEAATYNKPHTIERAQRVAAAIRGALPLDSSWTALDYGCGTGLLSWELASSLGHITLADESTGMLDVAAASIPDGHSGQFTVAQLDLAHTQPAEPVNLIYSSMAFHHMPDIPAALRGCYDALRPGGYLAIIDLAEDPHNHFHASKPDFDGHRGFSRHSLGAQIVEAGFDSPTFSTATVIQRGEPPRDFELFLAVTRKPTPPQASTLSLQG